MVSLEGTKAKRCLGLILTWEFHVTLKLFHLKIINASGKKTLIRIRYDGQLLVYLFSSMNKAGSLQ